MRRNYDTGYYRDLLAKVRERLPEAALGSDIIVGFPGETDSAFESSLEFFAATPLTYFHVFPYSKRRGTPAAEFSNALPAAVIKARARRMRELGVRKKDAFCRAFLGRSLAVLTEGKSTEPNGERRGFTRNYLPVRIVSGNAPVNQEISVTLRDYARGSLIGSAAAALAGAQRAQA
jgi:threonylcarbamoyladenosine tRNA methylthiotransferase MtaB